MIGALALTLTILKYIKYIERGAFSLYRCAFMKKPGGKPPGIMITQ
jgi:hypothetical protein